MDVCLERLVNCNLKIQDGCCTTHCLLALVSICATVNQLYTEYGQLLSVYKLLHCLFLNILPSTVVLLLSLVNLAKEI